MSGLMLNVRRANLNRCDFRANPHDSRSIVTCTHALPRRSAASSWPLQRRELFRLLSSRNNNNYHTVGQAPHARFRASACKNFLNSAQRGRDGLATNVLAVADEVEQLGLRVTAAPLPADPDGANRLFGRAAAGSRDTGDGNGNGRTESRERAGNHLDHRRSGTTRLARNRHAVSSRPRRCQPASRACRRSDRRCR